MKTPEFFKDKVVLITGASIGIGKDMAWQILQFGGKVIITGRRKSKLLAVQEEFNKYSERFLVHTGDVANYENDVELIDKIIEHFGRLDVLINNAGMSTDFGDLEITSEKVVDEIINTNVKGSIFTSMAAIPKLKETRGSILFMSSISGFQGQPGYALYSLSKMALTGLYQSLKLETKQAGVFVGISHVCFTENESAKRILSYEGQQTKVPLRSKLLTSPRVETARIILNQISKRKSKVVHSIFGKLIFWLSKYIPIINNLIFERVYRNIKKSRFTG